jgi:hypothetical protein
VLVQRSLGSSVRLAMDSMPTPARPSSASSLMPASSITMRLLRLRLDSGFIKSTWLPLPVDCVRQYIAEEFGKELPLPMPSAEPLSRCPHASPHAQTAPSRRGSP